MGHGLSVAAAGAIEPNPRGEREYPWGDEFDVNRLNRSESAMRWTSWVGAFLGGRRPCGAMEMGGNVWEWTRSTRSRGGDLSASIEEPRVVRGGSWYSDRDHVRCAGRYRDLPNVRDRSSVFRVVVCPF